MEKTICHCLKMLTDEVSKIKVHKEIKTGIKWGEGSYRPGEVIADIGAGGQGGLIAKERIFNPFEYTTEYIPPNLDVRKNSQKLARKKKRK